MSDQSIQVGEAIKRLRDKKGLSLEEIATRSGVATATLAGIEDQSVSPPLGTIILLAKALQVSLGDLFGDSADSPFCIVRSDARQTVPRFNATDDKTGRYTYESLGHQKQNRHMEPFLVTLPPSAPPQTEPNQHAGEEIIFVLDGQVEVSLAEHTDILNPGDSIYYDSNLPHSVSCHGTAPATILAVIYAEQEMIIC